jgi:dihydroorotase
LYFTKKETYLLTIQKQWKNYLLTANPLLPFIPKRRNSRNKRTEQYGEEDVPVNIIQLLGTKGCYEATKRAIDLAKNTTITYSTPQAETHLFQNDIPLKEKKITTEVSVHHLWFSDKDYERLGMLIKWNPAIKTEQDKEAY